MTEQESEELVELVGKQVTNVSATKDAVVLTFSNGMKLALGRWGIWKVKYE